MTHRTFGRRARSDDGTYDKDLTPAGRKLTGENH